MPFSAIIFDYMGIRQVPVYKLRISLYKEAHKGLISRPVQGLYVAKEGFRMLWHLCRCGAMIPQNVSQCSECTGKTERQQGGKQSRHMEYNRFRRDKKAAAFYVSADWRRARAAALRLYDGMDIYAYYVQHRIMIADMVHHIVEIDEDWEKRFDMTNLIPLSNSNHGIISALYEKDEATKKDTQEQLWGIIAGHWKDGGGIEKVLAGPI